MQLRYLVYPGFIISCLLIFWSTQDYRFITDNYTDFGGTGFHHMRSYINKVFDFKNKWTGFILIIAHGSLGYFIYRVLRSVLEKIDDEKAGIISLFTGVIFTLSPYSLEVVTYETCFVYILDTAMTFYALYCLAKYLESNSKIWFSVHFIIFTLSLVLFEISWVYPALFLLYGGVLIYAKGRSDALKQMIIKLLPIYVGIIAIFIIASKGDFGLVPRTIESENINSLQPSAVISNLGKYTVKMAFLVPFWKVFTREWIYALFDNFWITLGFTSAFLVSLFSYFYVKKCQISRLVPLISFLGFIIAVLPFLNENFSTYAPFEGGRLTYYAAPHFYLMVVSILVYSSKGYYWPIFLGYIGINSILLRSVLSTVRQAGDLTQGLVENFKLIDVKDLVFLCTPENLNGVNLLKDISSEGSAIKNVLIRYGDSSVYNAKTYNIAQVSLTNIRDSVKVTVINSSSLRVDATNKNTKFWSKGNRLSDYEDENFKITVEDSYFILTDKKPNPDRKYLYTAGDKWKSIQFR